jgi:NAD(P)-dependent dehydrogenase (short-subunit alcohol dehydrogenase family)
MTMNATPRHVLITGGLGTLGRAMAEKFIAHGQRVTVLDRPGASPLEGAGWLGIDLNDLPTVEREASAFAKAEQVDVLINNAALIINKPYEDYSLDEYEDQIRVNSSAAFALSRSCSPGMKARRWGRIINLTSITLNGQWDGYIPYVASKGAMLGLTKGFARELGPFGITVNAIAPGAVVSEAENRVFADRLEEYNAMVINRQCLKTRLQAKDVAELASFLTSEGARMITGQNIAIDGGW